MTFTLDRRHVTIEYPYGMSRAELESALRRVADSAKRAGSARTIGRLGIGIFSFQQDPDAAAPSSPGRRPLRKRLGVILKEGADEAWAETAIARESLAEPGLRVVISELKFDPTRSRGPLAPDTLRRYLAEKFEAYLREGWLAIEIRTGVGRFAVTPSRIRLPRLLADIADLAVPGETDRTVKLEINLDPSGRGRVAIRHHGVTVIEDLSSLAAYGLEEKVPGHRDLCAACSTLTSLTPLPARSGVSGRGRQLGVPLLDLLDRYLPTLRRATTGIWPSTALNRPARSANAPCGSRATFSTSTSSGILRCRAPDQARTARSASIRAGPRSRRPGAALPGDPRRLAQGPHPPPRGPGPEKGGGPRGRPGSPA